MKTVQITLSPSKGDYDVMTDPGDSLCINLPPGAVWAADPTLGIRPGQTAPFCQTNMVPGAFGLTWSQDGGRTTITSAVYVGSSVYPSPPQVSAWSRILNFLRRYI